MLNNRILYIEDDAQHRRVIRMILAHEGYTLLEAEDGPWGLIVAEQEHPALIVVDMCLPRMDGMEVISRIRRMPDLVRTPIIAVTANAALYTRAEYLESGCNEVMLKPFHLTRLVESVRQLLAPLNFAQA